MRCVNYTFKIIAAGLAPMPNIAEAFPHFQTVRTAAYRVRAKNFPPLPRNIGEVNIPDDYQHTTAGQQFLLYAAEDKAIIIFATNANIRRLSEAQEWAIDGTFDHIPSLYLQLWTIHAFIQDKLVPCIFALLCEKTALTYTRILRLLKDKAAELGYVLNPGLVHTDFESGFLPSFRTEFPNTQIRGCYFHFTQAIYKNILSKGFQPAYVNDIEIHRYLRQLMVLAFLPANHIANYYDAWKDDMPLNIRREIQPMLNYFEHQWLRACPPNIWSVYRIPRRTNNNLEGWHSGFAKRIGVSAPNFFVVSNY